MHSEVIREARIGTADPTAQSLLVSCVCVKCVSVCVGVWLESRVG